MATCRERSNGTFEFVVRRKRLLPKPIYLTFVVPDEFKFSQNQGQVTLAKLVRSYASGHTPKPDDLAKLDALVLEHGSAQLTRNSERLNDIAQRQSG